MTEEGKADSKLTKLQASEENAVVVREKLSLLSDEYVTFRDYQENEFDGVYENI